MTKKSQRDVDATLGTLGLVLDVAGGALLKNPVKAGVTQTVDTTADIAKAGAGAVGNVATKVDDVAGGVVKSVTDTVSDIPRRAQTNIDNARTIRETVDSLPSETAKTAVRDGVDINDVQRIYRTTDPNTQQSFKKLHETVKAFEADPSKTNPIELVGKPIVARLKANDLKAQNIGKELSAVADDLGEVASEELNDAIMKRLTGVRGLEGLRVGDDGLLDFADTTLASQLSKADQKAISEIFTEATLASSGKTKHLLRQELFEILNGKKQSLKTSPVHKNEHIRRFVKVFLMYSIPKTLITSV